MLATWMEPAPRTAVALDGKTLRGSFDHLHDRTTAHVLSAFASDAAVILAHHEVPAAPDEIGGVQAPQTSCHAAKASARAVR